MTLTWLIPEPLRKELSYRREGLHQDPRVPPARLIRVSRISQFTDTGEDWAERIVRAGLRASDEVLEVGCGSARVARVLTQHLSDGSYLGVDVDHEVIGWLQRNFSVQFPNFHFAHANIYNGFYNPEGELEPTSYEFPVSSASRDFVYFTSVFTHLLPMDASHYARESFRVLRPGGVCFASAFLLSDERRDEQRRFDAGRTFEHPVAPGCFADDPRVFEDAIAYDRSHFQGMFEEVGFELASLDLGLWSRSPQVDLPRGYQDVAVWKKI